MDAQAKMILVAIGSNRDGPWGNPRQAVMRAIAALDRGGIRVRRVSRLISTAPFGVIRQPSFINAVVEIETRLPPRCLLAKLHQIERHAGRRRTLRWGPRTLDLDLIDYHGQVIRRPHWPVLPHPGIAERHFVLAPIAEIAPRWRHPLTRRTAAAMLRKLDAAGEGAEI